MREVFTSSKTLVSKFDSPTAEFLPSAKLVPLENVGFLTETGPSAFWHGKCIKGRSNAQTNHLHSVKGRREC